jgi:hypothetical protein
MDRKPMEQFRDDRDLEGVTTPGQPLDLAEESETIPPGEYAAAYGEELSRTLDLDSWEIGEELAKLYQRLEAQVQEAVRQEEEVRPLIRQELFPKLWNQAGALPNAGIYHATVDQIEFVHRGLLFKGLVEACDGNSIPHDTLPLTIVQIGVCLVSYRGDQGSWVHRLYRHDLRLSGNDPVNEVLDLLERRRRRTGYDQESRRDWLTSLGRRGIMAYAERAVLLKRSPVPWKMGHGNPAPY